MRRILAMSLSAAMALVLLCSCSDTGSRETLIPSDPAEATQSVQPAPSPDPTAEPSPEPSEGPSVEPSEEPSAEPSAEDALGPVQEPSAAPSAAPSPTPTPKPTPAPTPTPAPAADPSPEPEPDPTPAAGVDLEAFSQRVRSGYGIGVTFTDEETGETSSSLMLLDPSDEMGQEYLANYYPGMADLDLVQCLIYLNMFSMNNSELALVQTADPEDAAKAAAILQGRIDYMVGDGDGPGGAWYPGPTEIWTNDSRVAVNGCYVMMVVGEQCDAVVSEFDALFR